MILRSGRLGAPLEICHLVGLLLGLLVGALELLFLPALLLFLSALAAQRRLAGHVSGHLLRLAAHLVLDAHCFPFLVSLKTPSRPWRLENTGIGSFLTRPAGV